MITYPDIPRIYTALAESIACLVFILQLPKRKHWFLNFMFFATAQIFLQMFVDVWPISLWFLGIAVNVLWMYTTILFTSKISKLQALHITCRAFVYSEFVAALCWQVICMVDGATSILFDQYRMSVSLLIYAAVFTIIYTIEAQLISNRNENSYYGNDIKFSIVTAITIFLVSNVGFIFPTDNMLANSPTVFTIRTTINLFGISVLYVLEKQHFENSLVMELSYMNNLVNTQYEQYLAFRESRDLLSIQLHDFKHQVEAIRLESDTDKRNEYLNNITEIMNKYGSNIETGNTVIDVLITRKNMYCIQNNITLTTFIDGQLLEFIDVVDLCTIIGNALDNAIESVEKNSNPESKIINVRIFKDKSFVIVHFENFSETQVDFSSGLPSTTKSSTIVHGYGLKSIEAIANKYNGSMAVYQENNWFNLQLVFNTPTQ